MTIKPDALGVLIYAAMAAFLAGFVGFALRARKCGSAASALGFGLSFAAMVLRGLQVGHVPLQSMFEVFLCLGAVVFPLSLFWRLVLGARGAAADALLAMLVLTPAGFVFSAEPQHLPPALQHWLFVPHVATYLLAYVILLKAGLLAARGLLGGAANPSQGQVHPEQAAHRLVMLGFPLLTGGLVLGACWGKLAWGDYWNWDPKELWSLATWLVFLGHLHLRSAFGRRFRRANCALVILGCLCIFITLLWVNLATRLFPGLHAYAA